MRARWLIAHRRLHQATVEAGEYTVAVQPVHTPRREIRATYVHPARLRHPGYVVVFTTGDDGWFGTSRAVFAHLVGQGYISPQVCAVTVDPKLSVLHAASTQNFPDS